jgi:hypothetical protein
MNKTQQSASRTAFERQAVDLDSHQKFANDVFARYGTDETFKHVHPHDRDEVRVQFSRLVAEAPGEVLALRVFPLHMTDKFHQARVEGPNGFVGQWQVKAGSGRIYWAGLTYAAQAQKAA